MQLFETNSCLVYNNNVYTIIFARDWTKKQRDRVITTANNSVIRLSKNISNLELSIYSIQFTISDRHLSTINSESLINKRDCI